MRIGPRRLGCVEECSCALQNTSSRCLYVVTVTSNAQRLKVGSKVTTLAYDLKWLLGWPTQPGWLVQLGGSQSGRDISWCHCDLHSSVQFEWDLMSIDQYGTVPGSSVSCTDGVEEGGVIVVVCGLLSQTHISNRLGRALWAEVALPLAGYHVCTLYPCSTNMTSMTTKFLPSYFTLFLFKTAFKQGVLGIKGTLQPCTFLSALTCTKASFLYREIMPYRNWGN